MLPIPFTAHRVPVRLKLYQITYSQTASLGLKASVSMNFVHFIHISCDFPVLFLITGSMKYEEIMQLALEMMALYFLFFCDNKKEDSIYVIIHFLDFTFFKGHMTLIIWLQIGSKTVTLHK